MSRPAVTAVLLLALWLGQGGDGAALLAGDIRVSLLGTVLFLIGMVLVAPVLLEPLAKVLSMLAAWVFAREGTGTMAEANLSRQPTRATITASATMVGLAILIALGGVATSIRGGFLDVLEKSLGSDYLLIPPAIGVWDSNVGAGNDLIERLRAAPGVETVSALWPAVSAVGESHANFALLGIDPVAYPRVAGLSFVAGSEAAAYSRLAQGRNVIANGILAAQEGLKVGDDVRLVTPTGEATYHVVAIASDYLNAKIPTAYISQANLKADFHKDESVFIQLNMTQGADPAKVRAELKRIGEDYPQFRIIAGREYYDENQQILDSSFLVFDMLIVVLAAPSLIALLNTLAVAVIERTREIGMLRASGATRRQVGRMIVAESLLLAGIGTALGLATGIYLSYVLVSAMSLGGYPVKYVFPTEGVVLAIVAGLAFGALAAIVPARQASRLQIIRALQYE